MHFRQPLWLALPHPGLDHPFPQRLFAYLDLMTLSQLFGGERRPKIVPFRLSQNRQRLPLCFGWKLAIRRPPSQPMHHYSITLLGHAVQ
jgi:hypothetical protein